MLLTEKEAAETICAMTFAIPEIPGQREAGPWMCAGTRCMQWRWAPGDWPDGTRGYCGLAGKPEVE